MKYIIDIPEDAKYGILTCKVGRGYYTKDIDLAETEQLTADYINENFGELQDQAYQKGFEDGKRKSEDGCTGCNWEGMTGQPPCIQCSNNYPNVWQAKSDKIEVGDELIAYGGSKCIATVADYENDIFYVMFADGSCGKKEGEILKRTGRHFDIASILEAMRHD